MDADVPDYKFKMKQDFVQKIIQKCNKAFESEETRKMMQVFVFDPILNYVLGRIFPYILIICVLFVVLTLLVTAILIVLFTKLPLVS
jgi:type IV secretory pathway VirB6-like protein